MKISLLILALPFTLISLLCQAQSGQLDTSFALEGLISNEEYPTPVLHSGVFTTDDKIFSVLQAVNVGEPTTYIRAYNLDGAIYSNFGTNGTLSIANFSAYDAAYSNEQNKIYIGGQTATGEDGFIDFDLSTELHELHVYPIENDYSDIMYNLSLTDNNEVVLSGYHINMTSNFGALRIVKFDSSMMVDDSFGENGKVTLQELEGTNGSSYGIDDMEIDEDGSIFLIGRINPTDKILKIGNTGAIDETFLQAIELSQFVAFNDLLITPNSRLILIPSISSTQQVIRLNHDGSLDITFATDGIFQLDSPNPDYLVYFKNGLIEDDGSIIVIGSYLSYTTSNFEGKSLIKLDQNGDVDPQFPFITNDIGYECGYNASFSTSHVAFQQDGKILSIDFTTCFDTETSLHQENILTRFTNDEASPVEEIATSNLLVYPNPAQNTLRITCDGKNIRAANIKIFDAMGNLVLAEVMRSEMLDVENLSPGIYFIHITEQNKTSVSNFVKE